MKRIVNILLGLFLGFTASAQELYDMDNITTIDIYFQQSNWDNLMDNNKALSDTLYLMADSVVINGKDRDSVGVKYKGNSTYDANNAKNPMNISLDYLKGKQDHQGFTTLKLSNGKNDPSFLREVLSYEVARKYMVAPQSNYAKVSVNGNYHGMYVSSESINSDFQRDYLFAGRNNTRFKCNPVDNFTGNGSSLEDFGPDSADYYDYYELKSDNGWHDLINLCNTIANNPSNIEQVLDVDKALWMLAFNNVMVNLDSYTGPFRQNYYLIKGNNGLLKSVVWDLNESLGGFEQINSGGGPPSLTGLQQLDPLLRQNESTWPLLELLLSDPMYKRMYIAHMRTILEENFSNGWYTTRMTALQSLIDAEIQADPNALYTYSEFTTNYSSSVSAGGPPTYGVTEVMNARITYLQSHQEFSYSPPSIGTVSTTPTIATPNSTPTINVSVSNATKVYLGYRFRPQDAFVRVEMFDDGLHNDGAAGDGEYGVDVAVDARDMQYYVYAENNDAGMFSPQRAEHEYYYLAVVSDLVINELMASNVTAATDQDGEYDDWVELYNGGTTAIDLTGYYLSDNENNLMKWTFPSIVLPADDYLVVWLDGDVAQVGMHSSFKLSADGEEIFLSDPSGTPIDAIFYNFLPEDMGFARMPNGTGAFTVQNHTINENNESGASIQPLEKNWAIYPNPAQTSFTIAVPYAKELRVFDLLGKEMTHLTEIRGSVNIDSRQWPAGMYLVELDGTVEKLMIQ